MCSVYVHINFVNGLSMPNILGLIIISKSDVLKSETLMLNSI